MVMPIMPGAGPLAEQLRILRGGSPTGFSVGGIFPNQRSQGGIFGGLMEKLNDPRAQLGLRILANSGPAPFKRGLGEILASSALEMQGFNQQQEDADMQRRLLEAQIKRAEQPDVPNSVAEYKFAVENGFEGSFEDFRRSRINEGRPPASIEEYNLAREQGYKGSFLDFQKEVSKSRVGAPFIIGEFGGARGTLDRTGGGFAPITTLPQEVDARGQIAGGEAAGRELGQAEAERVATLEGDLAKIDDEITRTERLIKEFESGRHQTGPLAALFPNIRTAAQDLQREQGKDVISAISSATFGQLSEGEREFLRTIGISESANEESNINLLKRRKQELQRTRERLANRKPLVGSGQPAGPQGGVRRYNPATGRIENAAAD